MPPVIENIFTNFNAIIIHIPADSFSEIDQLILKLIQKFKEPRTQSYNVEKEGKVGGMTLPNFKTYHKNSVVKPVWYWHIYQWDRIESPAINPYFYGRWFLARVHSMEMEQSFQQMVLGQLVRYPHAQELRELNPYLTPPTHVPENGSKS